MVARRTREVLCNQKGGGQQDDSRELCIFQSGAPADMPHHVTWHSAQGTRSHSRVVPREDIKHKLDQLFSLECIKHIHSNHVNHLCAYS